jgi:uncharacterized membrane protein
MNFKQYRNFKIIVALVLAVIISQAVIMDNYILAIIAVLTAMILVFLAKQTVRGVLADERDYEIAGKSARYSLGIFSVTGALAMLFFTFSKTEDIVFGVIASTLAYSVCALLLLYSIIYKFLSYKGYEKQD